MKKAFLSIDVVNVSGASAVFLAIVYGTAPSGLPAVRHLSLHRDKEPGDDLPRHVASLQRLKRRVDLGLVSVERFEVGNPFTWDGKIDVEVIED